MKSLSIQFSLDGFSFSIIDDISKEVILLTNYTFNETVSNPELLTEKLSTIFTDEDLQDSFTSIKAIHQNNLATIVPDLYFDESKLSSYLQYSIKTLTTDFITFDDLPKNNAKNIYIPFVNINNYLFQNFGEFEFNHHTTVLINKLVEYNKFNIPKTMYVNVSKSEIDIIILKFKNILFYNTFTYQTKEDFIYYILFVVEQLKLNREEFPLVFSGDININSDLYDIVFTYIRNVSFIEPTSNIFENGSDFLSHSNFTLT